MGAQYRRLRVQLTWGGTGDKNKVAHLSNGGTGERLRVDILKSLHHNHRVFIHPGSTVPRLFLAASDDVVYMRWSHFNREECFKTPETARRTTRGHRTPWKLQG